MQKMNRVNPVVLLFYRYSYVYLTAKLMCSVHNVHVCRVSDPGFEMKSDSDPDSVFKI